MEQSNLSAAPTCRVYGLLLGYIKRGLCEDCDRPSSRSKVIRCHRSLWILNLRGQVPISVTQCRTTDDNAVTIAASYGGGKNDKRSKRTIQGHRRCASFRSELHSYIDNLHACRFVALHILASSTSAFLFFYSQSVEG